MKHLVEAAIIPVLIKPGGVIEYPTRPDPEDGMFIGWGCKSVVLCVTQGVRRRALRSCPISFYQGQEMLSGSSTEWPPLRLVDEEPWPVERIVRALHVFSGGEEAVPFGELMAEWREDLEAPAAVYPMGTMARVY